MHRRPRVRQLPRRTERARLLAMLEHGCDLALVCAPDLTVLQAAPSQIDLLDCAADVLVGRNATQWVAPDDVDVLLRLAHDVLRTPWHTGRAELRTVGPTGRSCWVEVRVADLVRDPDVGGLLVTARDITAQQTAAQALVASQALHRAVVETAGEGIWVVDAGGRGVLGNARMSELLETDDLRGARVWDYLDEHGAAALRSRPLTERAEYELSLRLPSGTRRTVRVLASPLTPDGAVAVCTDVTHGRDAATQLRRLALHDGLTGLPGRTLLADRHAQLREAASQSVDPPEPYSVVLLDLDGLRAVNVAAGQLAGDRFVVEVAQRLRAAVRPVDTVARTGGGEFAVLLPGASARAADAFARRLVDAVAQPVLLGEQAYVVTACAGTAGSDLLPRADLVAAAGRALARAKQVGPGRALLHDAGWSPADTDEAALTADLLAALGTEQLSLAYQPVLDLGGARPPLGLAGERVVGAEALLRWQHPVRGAVPPATFIPLAESHGLMDALGSWTLRQACADAAGWPAHLRVAVNLSARQLVGPGIVAAVEGALAGSGLAPQRLTLEVTETAVLEEIASAGAALRAIAALGVEVSLDDFGTGYSSLAHLRLLPISEIKIDRAFTAGLGLHDSDDAIVATLVTLASALGVRAVAEGVETPLQRDTLKALGCPCAQGWLWSAALPADRFAEVVRGSLPEQAGAATG